MKQTISNKHQWKYLKIPYIIAKNARNGRNMRHGGLNAHLLRFHSKIIMTHNACYSFHGILLWYVPVLMYWRSRRDCVCSLCMNLWHNSDFMYSSVYDVMGVVSSHWANAKTHLTSSLPVYICAHFGIIVSSRARSFAGGLRNAFYRQAMQYIVGVYCDFRGVYNARHALYNSGEKFHTFVYWERTFFVFNWENIGHGPEAV